MVDYKETKFDSCVTYDFTLNSIKIRVNIYQKKNKNIEDTSFIPHVIYGELNEEIKAKYPLMGIKYTPIDVNRDELIKAVVDMVNIFLNKYNSKVQYEFIKVVRTENIETKAEIHNQECINTISDIEITEIDNTKNKGNKIKKNITYILNKL